MCDICVTFVVLDFLTNILTNSATNHQLPPTRDAHTWNWDHGTVISNSVAYSIDSSGNELAGEGDGDEEEVGAGGSKVEIKSFNNIYAALRYYRTLKTVPMGQEFITMRTGMPLPTLGLGTGGLDHRELPNLLRHAVELGYRTFDLAREYGNEHIVANAIAEIEAGVGVRRHHLFLISKVWPTQLGVVPTRDAVRHSLRDLRTSYIDAYLLHWPKCDANIDWHHCRDTVDPKGTWQQSWRALEREYAEGRVMNIGVSNFDLPLLHELGQHAKTAVQIVQNHAEIGDDQATDKNVRVWCRKRGTVYMPYAHQRNLQFLPEHLKESLQQISEMTGRSAHSVASRFFVQGGAAIIPRSSSPKHLAENAQVGACFCACLSVCLCDCRLRRYGCSGPCVESTLVLTPLSIPLRYFRSAWSITTCWTWGGTITTCPGGPKTSCEESRTGHGAANKYIFYILWQ